MSNYNNCSQTTHPTMHSLPPPPFDLSYNTTSNYNYNQTYRCSQPMKQSFSHILIRYQTTHNQANTEKISKHPTIHMKKPTKIKTTHKLATIVEISKNHLNAHHLTYQARTLNPTVKQTTSPNGPILKLQSLKASL